MYDETAMLRFAMDCLGVGYAVLDGNLCLQFFNDRYIELIGVDPSLFGKGLPVRAIVEERVRSGVLKVEGEDNPVDFLLAELRSPQPFTREIEGQDGLVLKLSGFPLPQGGVLITFTDISAQRLAEKQKEITEDRLRRALDNIEGAVLMYDKDLIVQVYSKRYLEIGNLPENLFQVGKPIYPVLLYRAERGDYGEGDPRKLADERAEFLRNIPDNLYQEQPMGDGIAEVYWSRDDQGNLISVTNDITRRKQTEQLLEEARRDAQAANKAKSDFLANMSHELRTPLNAVIGFSDYMLAGLTGELNERQSEYVQDISNSGAHLLALINDVLDLSKIEAGRLEVEETVFDLSAIVEESVSLVRETATLSHITLSRRMNQEPVVVQADLRMIKQIIVNLLSNDVKFTPEGCHVSIQTQRRGDGDLMISVTDTGYGMKPEEIPLALKEFEQTETGREHGGTGLGLPLTKNMVELHGGMLSIISAPGKGTTAMFSIPAGRILDGQSAAQ